MDQLSYIVPYGFKPYFVGLTFSVSAGNTIDLDIDQTTLTGTVTVTFRHDPTNTLLGDVYTFQDVT